MTAPGTDEDMSTLGQGKRLVERTRGPRPSVCPPFFLLKYLFGTNVLPGIFVGYALIAEEFGNVSILTCH